MAELPDASICLLAGGRAVRLGGVAKERLVRPDGLDVVTYARQVLEPLVAEILLSRRAPDATESLRVVVDAEGEGGPPAGVRAALAACRTEWLFVLGGDQAFVSPALLRLLYAERAGVDAVVPRQGGVPQVLTALYSTRCLAPFRAAHAAGAKGLPALLATVRVRWLDEVAWSGVDPEGRSFADADAPEDLTRLGLTAPR